MQALCNLLLSNDLLSCKNNKSANLRKKNNMNLKELHLFGLGILLLSFPSCTQEDDLVDTSVGSGVSVHSEAASQKTKDVAIPVSKFDISLSKINIRSGES